MKFCNYNLVHILILPILFSSISINSNFAGEGDNNSNNGYNSFSLNFLQNSYAIETDENDKDSKETKGDESENNEEKSVFNFVAVGDWDCTSETVSYTHLTLPTILLV